MTMQTVIKRGFITDLVLPQPGTNGRTAEEIEQMALETGIEFMHDLLNWPRMNPLVYNVELIHHSHPKAIDVAQLATDFRVPLDSPQALTPFIQHEITDKLDVAFGYKRDLTYSSAMRKTQNGMEGLTDPGSGVKIHGRFELKKSKAHEDVLNLVEMVEIRCNVLLGVYIKATLGSSHKHMHENFKKKWNEEMKRKLAA